MCGDRIPARVGLQEVPGLRPGRRRQPPLEQVGVLVGCAVRSFKTCVAVTMSWSSTSTQTTGSPQPSPNSRPSEQPRLNSHTPRRPSPTSHECSSARRRQPDRPAPARPSRCAVPTAASTGTNRPAGISPRPEEMTDFADLLTQLVLHERSAETHHAGAKLKTFAGRPQCRLMVIAEEALRSLRQSLF